MDLASKKVLFSGAHPHAPYNGNPTSDPLPRQSLFAAMSVIVMVFLGHHAGTGKQREGKLRVLSEISGEVRLDSLSVVGQGDLGTRVGYSWCAHT